MNDDPYSGPPFRLSPRMVWFEIISHVCGFCLLAAIFAGLLGPFFQTLYVFVLAGVRRIIPLHPDATSWYIPNFVDHGPSFVPAWWWYPLVAVLLYVSIIREGKNEKTETRVDPREPSMLICHLFGIFSYVLGSFMINWLMHKICV